MTLKSDLPIHSIMSVVHYCGWTVRCRGWR